MSTATREKNKKNPITPLIPCLTKKLGVSVCKMKVMELNKWTPVLQSEETLKLCFEGSVSRINGQKRKLISYKTLPLDARLGNYLFRQANGELCSLVGELYDPSNNLPLPVKSKFKNGIPRKWQRVAEFWDSIQKHSFCRRQLRKFSSRIEWLESLKTSGLLRVSSRGRIIIPSPKYLKGKNVEQREVERAHLINSHLELIRTNLELSPVHITDNTVCTPRQLVANNCNSVNGTKSRQCTTCENHTENSLHKKNVCRKISAHNRCFNMQTQQNHLYDTRRSSLNQRKLITCKRKLIVAEVQNKMCRSSKASKNTYEKITKKYHYRCLPHRRKYLLRSTSDTRLLQKNNKCKKELRVTSVNVRVNDRIVIPQRKRTLQSKRKVNVLNNKNNLQCQGKSNTFSHRIQTREGKSSKEAGSCNENAVRNRVLKPEANSEVCRNQNAVNVEKNKGFEQLLKLPCKQPCLQDRDVKSGNDLRNCANMVRRSKRQICCQDRCDTKRPKKKSENSPARKVTGRDVKTPLNTHEDSGPAFTERKSTGCVEASPSPKIHEERNFESIPAKAQDLLENKVAPRKISQHMSRRDRFSEKCTSSALNTRKCSQSRLASSERQRGRRSVVTRQLNEKDVHKMPVKSRKKSLSTNKSNTDVASAMEITAEVLEDTKEAATTIGTAESSTSKRNICKEDSKLPRISDPQSSEETEPSIPSEDISEPLPRKIGKPEPHLSLSDIDDILNTGAPRTLKQRKKLRKTIDSYAKSQNTCSDLFSDPDYNHLIGDDTSSSQQWDRDYAEAVEELVGGKFSDQISLGSTSPAQYIQDFFSDDNQSVRSTSPFERTACDEEFKVRYVHRVLKEKNEHTKRRSLNVDFMSSFGHSGTDASTEADAAYTALIQGKPVSQKLFDLKCKKKNNTSSDDSSSECSDEL